MFVVLLTYGVGGKLQAAEARVSTSASRRMRLVYFVMIFVGKKFRRDASTRIHPPHFVGTPQ